MSLPISWVDKIFGKLAVTYGHQFLTRYRDMDMDAVKFDWAQELAGFEKNPAAIAFALSHIDAEYPPTSRKFVQLCLMAPDPEFKLLPAPPADRARIDAEFAKLGNLRAAVNGPVNWKAWAKRLQARELAGEKLGQFQRRAWREALIAPSEVAS